jgi:hypothetical protein
VQAMLNAASFRMLGQHRGDDDGRSDRYLRLS